MLLTDTFLIISVGAKWRQQQIPACRPVFTAKHVFVAFGTIGLVFLALGIAFTVILSDVSIVYNRGYIII